MPRYVVLVEYVVEAETSEGVVAAVEAGLAILGQGQTAAEHGEMPACTAWAGPPRTRGVTRRSIVGLSRVAPRHILGLLTSGDRPPEQRDRELPTGGEDNCERRPGHADDDADAPDRQRPRGVGRARQGGPPPQVAVAR